MLSIKERDDGAKLIPLSGISLGKWSANNGVPVIGGAVPATAVVLSSQMGDSPGSGGIVIECFEVGVLDGFEVVIGWREIQVDDVMRVVGGVVDGWRTIFLADFSEVEGPGCDRVKHVIFIVRMDDNSR